jgi:hypothetical protein
MKIVSSKVNLSSQSKSSIKRALLCRTGKFDGMYGKVTVTIEMLELIASKYLSDKEKPTNENDFVPILLDHNRAVDLVKGRLLASGMVVEEWKEIDGEMTYGLFGNLRIDDPEAMANVDSGKYAQLSISFDEESGELFEVSFVAVEAARGSIVLSKSEGGKRMGKKSLAQLKTKHLTALKSAVGESRKNRKVALSALMTKANEIQAELVVLEAKSQTIALTVKQGQIKGKFSALTKGGKMSPVELKALDVKSLAALDSKSLAMVLAAYESRPVSTDVFQFGQKSDKKPIADLSPAAMREAIKLQRSGKGTKLAAEDDTDDDGDKNKKDGKKELSADDEDSMSSGDMKTCLEEMQAHHEKLAECMDKMKELSGYVKSMSDDEEKDEGKEKEMSAKDEDEEKKAKEEGEE